MSLLLLEGELDDYDVANVLESEPIISLHALLGNDSPHTMRLKGVVNGKAICILVDGGSTHNFIQAQVTTYLGLSLHPNTSLCKWVMDRHFLVWAYVLKLKSQCNTSLLPSIYLSFISKVQTLS
ncbi:hypothetical protein CFOL_v3_28658 [Cephalotus follicularis]|uniref:Asp_protease_2 domain-containing protein n=1 Tax=Cephalotus follicularis TaxID=3775 RepID=A0A1Q3CY95_CEPFO|nr:hypothetical protein CFOL_v3_28658 [Cephalotus follicularis]